MVKLGTWQNIDFVLVSFCYWIHFLQISFVSPILVCSEIQLGTALKSGKREGCLEHEQQGGERAEGGLKAWISLSFHILRVSISAQPFWKPLISFLFRNNLFEIRLKRLISHKKGAAILLCENSDKVRASIKIYNQDSKRR